MGVNKSTHHWVESPKLWCVGDPQDAQCCLGSDFCLLCMITIGILRGPSAVFMAEVQKHVVCSFIRSLRVLGPEGSVRLGEIHVFQELNDRAL